MIAQTMLIPPHILLAFSILQAPPADVVPPSTDRDSEAVRVEITPTAWFARLLGTYSIGPGGTDLDVETDTDLHDSELSFQGELDFRFDAWSIRVLGTQFSTSGEGVLDQSARVAGTDLAAGSDWSSSYAQWSIGAEIDYALWRPFADEPFAWSSEGTASDNTNADGDYLVEFRLGPRVGFQYLHVDQTFESTAGNLAYEFDGSVGALVLGILIEAEIDTRPVCSLLHQITIEAGGTVSPVFAGGSGYLSSIAASFRAYFTPNASVGFGFRLQGTSFTSEEYERKGSVMGMIAGVSLRF